MVTFKPMLAVMWEKQCKYPKYASLKYDGIRAVFKDGQLLSRSLKPIRNVKIQEKFDSMRVYTDEHEVIFDGEFYSHELTFQEISSVVNSSDKEVPESLKFHCFDLVDKENYDEEYHFRWTKMNETLPLFGDIVVFVEQRKVNNKDDIDAMFEKALEEGFEGLILRDICGRYKCGRSTVNEELLLKVKPFETHDLIITAVHERMKNTNDKQTNELGNSFRRNTVDAKEETGIAACFETIYNGFPMRVTCTGVEEFRREIWKNKEKYIGKMMEVRGMTIGAKDVLRHPTFIRFREDKD